MVGVMLAACYESATTALTVQVVPAEVRWLEWPAQVATVEGESLRVVVYAPCGTPLIGVMADSGRLYVTAEEEVNLDGSCLGTTNGMYDTVLALPELSPPEPPGLFTPAPFIVTAPVRNYVTGALETASLGVIELSFRPPFQATRLVAGRARMSVDTGCAWIRPDGLPNETHLALNPPSAISEGQARAVLIGGAFAPADPPVCGRATGIQLRYAQVDVLP